MAHKTLINGTVYEVSGGKTLVNGTGYNIASGRTLVDGTGYDISFVNIVPISTLAVGSSVFMNVNGVSTEFLVVNQGIPSSSSLYDSSCDGAWLLMKDVYETRVWESSDVNDYQNSEIHNYLNSDFLSLFDSNIQIQIKTVKIPYVNGTGGSAVASGTNGLSTKIFLLSTREIGSTSTSTSTPVDGAKLDYFEIHSATTMAKCIAYYNGTAFLWWLRSPRANDTGRAYRVDSSGGITNSYTRITSGIRPALVLPSETLVNDKTFQVIV